MPGSGVPYTTVLLDGGRRPHPREPPDRLTLPTGSASRRQGSAALALLDRLPSAVPHHAGVVAIAVEVEHRRDDVLDGLLLVDDSREISQVLLRRANRLGRERRPDAMVPGDDDLRLERCDLVEVGDPVLA